MIRYTSRGFRLRICQTHGSVFPSALIIALPCAAATATLRHIVTRGRIPELESPDSVMTDAAAWSGFSFLVGFLVVFRTSQAYQRYWDGCTSVYRMGAEWFDACSSLIAFCQKATANKKDVTTFKSTAACLFSMLHSCALADLEDGNLEHNNRQSFTYDILGAAVVDHGTLQAIRDSSRKVELLYTWIQHLIVQAIDTGVMAIPAPILTRAFAELSRGMVAYHDALEIGDIPFPFPYAQTCDCLLAMHWIVVPFVNSQWATSPFWAAIFSFVQVFIFWSLYFIAVEIENPFGTDANDLEGDLMQQVMNERLLLLVSSNADHTPQVNVENVEDLECHERSSSFRTAWTLMPGRVLSRASTRRRHTSGAKAATGRAASLSDSEVDPFEAGLPKPLRTRSTSSDSSASQITSFQALPHEAPRLATPVSTSAPSLALEKQVSNERHDQALPPLLIPDARCQAQQTATTVPASAPNVALEEQGPKERHDEAENLPANDSSPQRPFSMYDRPWLQEEDPLPMAPAPPLPAETEDDRILRASRKPTFDMGLGKDSADDFSGVRPPRLGQKAASARGPPPPPPPPLHEGAALDP